MSKRYNWPSIPPQMMHQISVETIEETDVSRTQELRVAVSRDGGQSYRQLRRQDLSFSPPETTFKHEDWAVLVEDVTHLQLRLKPDKGGQPYRTTLTAPILQRAEH